MDFSQTERVASAIQAASADVTIRGAATAKAALPNNEVPRLDESPAALAFSYSIRPRLGASESLLILKGFTE